MNHELASSEPVINHPLTISLTIDQPLLPFAASGDRGMPATRQLVRTWPSFC